MKEYTFNIEFNNDNYDVILIVEKRKTIKFKINNNKIIIVSPKKYKEKELIELLNKNKNRIIKAINRPRIELNDNEMYLLGYKIDKSKYTKIELDNMIKDALKQIDDIFNKVQKEFPSVSHYYHKMRSRWGVCYPTKRRIGLSTYLVYVPLYLSEYVIYHEFCHLKHCNHSSYFYDELKKYVPLYKEYRKELKLYSTLL